MQDSRFRFGRDERCPARTESRNPPVEVHAKMADKKVASGFDYNILSSVFLYIIAFVFLFLTHSLKNSGSRVFPYIVCILTIILSTALLWKTARNGRRGNGDAFDFSGTLSALSMCVILLLYIAATTLTGFYLSTPLYLALSMWVLGQRNKKIIIVVSAMTPLVIYLFFTLLLGMRVPEGVLFSYV